MFRTKKYFLKKISRVKMSRKSRMLETARLNCSQNVSFSSISLETSPPHVDNISISHQLVFHISLNFLGHFGKKLPRSPQKVAKRPTLKELITFVFLNSLLPERNLLRSWEIKALMVSTCFRPSLNRPRTAKNDDTLG